MGVISGFSNLADRHFPQKWLWETVGLTAGTGWHYFIMEMTRWGHMFWDLTAGFTADVTCHEPMKGFVPLSFHTAIKHLIIHWLIFAVLNVIMYRQLITPKNQFLPHHFFSVLSCLVVISEQPYAAQSFSRSLDALRMTLQYPINLVENDSWVQLGSRLLTLAPLDYLAQTYTLLVLWPCAQSSQANGMLLEKMYYALPYSVSCIEDWTMYRGWIEVYQVKKDKNGNRNM